MNYIEPLFEIDFKTVILGVLVALIAFQFLVKLGQWLFVEFLGLETKSMRNRREEHELLMQTAEGLKELSEKQKDDVDKIYNDSLEHYHQSCEIRDNLADSINSISEKLDEMKKDTEQRFKHNEEKENERVQAELKDRISQLYRYYHAKGQINNMEIEALEGLIASYESYGGQNSFVHSVVQKEMYTWEITENK